MNRPLRRVAGACAVLLVLLLLNLNYLQVIKANGYRTDPRNVRVLLEEYNRQRGAIVVGNDPIAFSKATSDSLKYLRVYLQPQLYAFATGYYSHVYGSTGLERYENSILAGTDDRLFVKRIVELLTQNAAAGGDVLLTLNAAAQAAAYKGLAGRKGAVVAIEPSTGRILAMVSSPSFDPNLLAAHDGGAETQAWTSLNADPNTPLLNRALNQTYPPGSTFKLITAAAALSSGQYTPTSPVPGPAKLALPQTTITLPNDFKGTCTPGSDQTTITAALQRSCNTTFAALGMKLGDTAIRRQADAFGFDTHLNVPSQVAPSVFPRDLNQPETAQSAIGQYNTRATPLQMAMVVAAIANGGTLMTPYLVDQLRSHDLEALSRTTPQVLSHAITPQVAAELNSIMVGVVDSGTGTNAAINGVKVAGKTGTAQTADGKNPDAWFVSFAPADNPTVAVAVVLENGGSPTQQEISGNLLAAPIAKAVMQAVLGK